MSSFAGDFLGFQFGDIHSSSLNITRVSTSDRYADDLNPNFTDQTAAVPGGDGTYYWNSNYTQRVFNIDFAYDDLRDEDIQRLRQIFGTKEIKPLIFDESSYKKYMVKSMQPATLKYICFDVEDIRIYKGEGSVRLVAYYPFATSVNDFDMAYSEEGTVVGNRGDLDSDYKIIYTINDTPNIELSIKDIKENQYGKIKLENISKESEKDMYILINSKTNLVEGLDKDFNKTGNLYNKYITEGDFFKIRPGLSTFYSNAGFVSGKYNSIYF